MIQLTLLNDTLIWVRGGAIEIIEPAHSGWGVGAQTVVHIAGHELAVKEPVELVLRKAGGPA
jgi:hypothetical protein